MMHFESQYWSKEVYELQNFKPASLDDIAVVHARSYIHGLEKVFASLKPSLFLFQQLHGWCSSTFFHQGVPYG